MLFWNFSLCGVCHADVDDTEALKEATGYNFLPVRRVKAPGAPSPQSEDRMASSRPRSGDRAAEQNFHQLLGVEVSGVVYTAPIIQPTQASFSSFDGKGELGGNLTRSEAVRLADALTARSK